MARRFLIASLALLAVAPPAAAQTLEQRENRRVLRESQRQLDLRSFERDLDARAREQALRNRAERDALELRLRQQVRPLQPLDRSIR